ncbi:brassinosteroid-related acyltransferase 1 [Phoenix dactylifera]|uniref:Brassinosteroid-related acyltransferase 1 n=1 Tax=Phoenix dactylifera TaxID=42345 RepID=A0A8B7C211_PHODC|nr:brassinosteroid-related acyltransferase 1 [Phoenix dactylifera]
MAIQREDYHKVLITKTTTVYPRAHPHEARVIQLSNLDRKCPLLMYLVFFYRSPPPHQRLSAGSLFSSLKTGLEDTLSAWYPAAGRLFLSPPNGKLDLVCTNSGALLVEAATRLKISELGDLSQYNDFYEHLVFRPPLSSSFSDMPLVVAQVTKFGCGGYAMGVGTNHSLFDGLANYNFMNAWASKTVGKADEAVELVEPVHERGRLLVGRGQIEENLTRPGGREKMTRVTAVDHLYLLIEQAVFMKRMDPDGKLQGEYKFSDVGSANHEQSVLRTFSLRSSMVVKLKSKATRGLSGTSCSSFEVVAAHLWKARTKALGIPKDRTVCLQFAVDTRTRMDPTLPKGFTGNAYVLSSISCTSGELERETLATIIEKIKEAKQSVNNDYVGAYLEALEAPQGVLPPLPELTMVSDWTRTPYHKVDFGLGDAIYVSPLASPFQQVAYFMQSPNDGGGIEVRIGLLQKHVPAFSHYFLDKL